MRSKLTLTFALLVLNLSLAFSTALPPLILKGKLTNCKDKIMILNICDENFQYTEDTIRVNKDGSFYLKSTKISRPQRTNIYSDNTHIRNLYLAPGFDLKITGDAVDYKTLSSTLKIEGIGSKINQYQLRLAKIARDKKQVNWYELDSTKIKPWIHSEKATADSVFNTVFDNHVAEPYVNDFKRMIAYDIRFTSMYYWLDHINGNKYNLQEAKKFARNIPDQWLRDISNDDYTLSEDYKDWFQDSYINYLKKIDNLTDSAIAKTKGYRLKTIKNSFSGTCLDYYLYQTIKSSLNFTKTIEALDKSKPNLEVYISSVGNDKLREILKNKLVLQEQYVKASTKGSPAFAFNLKSDQNTIHTLSEFRGKVIYVDLWASWCSPCREEIPLLKTIAEKYKGNQKLEIISVAVHDTMKNWKDALAFEKMSWLQLFDANKEVSEAYRASAIPRYILIDKNGNLVSNDAPRPSSEKKLLALLDEELAK